MTNENNVNGVANENIRNAEKRGHLNYGKMINYKIDGYTGTKYHSMLRCLCGKSFSVKSWDISEFWLNNDPEIRETTVPAICPECGTVIEEDLVVNIKVNEKKYYNSSHIRFIDDENMFTIATVILIANNTNEEYYPIISNDSAIRLKFRFNREKRTGLMYINKFQCEDDNWGNMKLKTKFINFTQPVLEVSDYFQNNRLRLDLVVPMSIREEFKEFVGANWPLEALSGFEDLAWANRIPDYEEAKHHRKVFSNLQNAIRYESLSNVKEILDMIRELDQEHEVIGDILDQKIECEKTLELHQAYKRYVRFLRTGHAVKDFKVKTLKALKHDMSQLSIENIDNKLIDSFLRKPNLATKETYSIIEELFDSLENKKHFLKEAEDEIEYGEDIIYEEDLSLIKEMFDFTPAFISDVYSTNYYQNVRGFINKLKAIAEKIIFLESKDIKVDLSLPFKELESFVNLNYDKKPIPKDIDLLTENLAIEDFDLGDGYVFKVLENTNELIDMLEYEFMSNVSIELENYIYNPVHKWVDSTFTILSIEKHGTIEGFFEVYLKMTSDTEEEVAWFHRFRNIWLSNRECIDKVILFGSKLGLQMSKNFLRSIKPIDNIKYENEFDYNMKTDNFEKIGIPLNGLPKSYLRYLLIKRDFHLDDPLTGQDTIILESNEEHYEIKGISNYLNLIELSVENNIYIPDEIDGKCVSFYSIKENDEIVAIFAMNKRIRNDYPENTPSRIIEKIGLWEKNKIEGVLQWYLHEVYSDFLIKLQDLGLINLPNDETRNFVSIGHSNDHVVDYYDEEDGEDIPF